jgi:hypothetical protein
LRLERKGAEGQNSFRNTKQTLQPSAPIPSWLAHLDLRSAETWNTASEESRSRKSARKAKFAASILSSVFAIIAIDHKADIARRSLSP